MARKIDARAQELSKRYGIPVDQIRSQQAQTLSTGGDAPPAWINVDEATGSGIPGQLFKSATGTYTDPNILGSPVQYRLMEAFTGFGKDLNQRDQDITKRNKQNEETLATRQRNTFSGSQSAQSTSLQKNRAGIAGMMQTLATGARGLLAPSRTRKRQLLGS